MKIKLIVLIGRRWFDKRNGNTYHDTEIITYSLTKTNIVHHRTKMQYGYGDSYIETGAR